MASKVSSAQVNTLISQYLNLYEVKYGNRPNDFNRYREKWGFQSMIEDLGFARAKEVVSYYFDTNNIGHPVSKLLYNYEKIDEIMTERAADDELRSRLRRESEARVKAWREKNGG